MKLLKSAPLLLLAATACVPAAPPPAPAPSPPQVIFIPEAEDRAGADQARRSWEEATTLGRQGRWGEAEVRLRAAVRQEPENPTYHAALGTALLQQGRESEAADALLAGIRAGEAAPRPSRRILIADYERVIEILNRVGRLEDARVARVRQAEHRRLRDAEGQGSGIRD
ncbi:MAG TPA: tetratricopeptide repeat protein [Longimicrobium sp.]|nr:tetratricopeptide repeat protein [Longimicrobium sp.]